MLRRPSYVKRGKQQGNCNSPGTPKPSPSKQIRQWASYVLPSDFLLPCSVRTIFFGVWSVEWVCWVLLRCFVFVWCQNAFGCLFIGFFSGFGRLYDLRIENKWLACRKLSAVQSAKTLSITGMSTWQNTFHVSCKGLACFLVHDPLSLKSHQLRARPSQPPASLVESCPATSF